VMRPIDEALLASEDLKNLDQIAKEVASEDRSVETFLDRRFGFCLARDDEIVAWCLSEYNTGDRCEVGIMTDEDYRKRGFATLTGSALIEHALSTGVSGIGWHCWASNEGSIATALKVGFDKAKEYPVYFAWFDESANLAVNGNMRLRRGQYREAIAWYERAFALGKVPFWAYWNVACAHALVGESDVALDYLVQAVDEGLSDLNDIRNSAHFESLLGTETWQRLLGALEGQLGTQIN
jgi:RimJ/RimL family protein N-acetyltransferase